MKLDLNYLKTRSEWAIEDIKGKCAGEDAIAVIKDLVKALEQLASEVQK
jgi:hypothetical protein